MPLPDNIMHNDEALNNLAKDLFKIDFENSEFHFVMLSALISLLLNKGIISEEEFEKETQEASTAFKLFKYRNELQKDKDSGV
jgi:hypothetical protein